MLSIFLGVFITYAPSSWAVTLYTAQESNQWNMNSAITLYIALFVLIVKFLFHHTQSLSLPKTFEMLYIAYRKPIAKIIVICNRKS